MTATSNRALYARLLGYVKPYRLAFAGSVLAMAIGGAVQGSFAWFLNNLLDKLFVQGNEQYAWIAAVGIVVIFVVNGISTFIAGYGLQWFGNSYIAHGWDVAPAADAEPIRSRMQLFAA